MSVKNFRELGRKIVCVGRNYREHALELKNPIPSKPLLFVKTTNSYVTEGSPIEIPEGCTNLHHEVELAVVIGKLAKKVSKQDAMNYVAGYAAALDLTARDWQDEFKSAGHPWFLAKSFDGSCPITDFIDKSAVSDPHNVELFCKVDGKDRQRAVTNAMIFDIPTLLEFITKTVTLVPGDVVLTGTPEGVGPIKPGNKVEFGITGVIQASFEVK
ncbi:Protein FAHD-1 [Aphelenchoides avenae]|nr:Protein FAHD-1 [Aphelenchus avenae]